MAFRLLFIALVLNLVATVQATNVVAQGTTPRPVTAQDYARAEQFLGRNTSGLVFRTGVSPNWLDGDRFWFRSVGPAASEFILVDPDNGSRGPAFDHARVAAALSSIMGATFTAEQLPFQSFQYAQGGESIVFTVDAEQFTCEVDGDRCSAMAAGESAPIAGVGRGRRGGGRGGIGGRGGRGGGRGGGGGAGSEPGVDSPDGSQSAFIRNHNLWVRNLDTGEERQLTTDGVEDFGYATDNAGWTKSDRAVLVWSPDSRKIATFQHDSRGVGEMYLVSTGVGHPTLEAWKYPLPEDSVIFRISRVIVDVDAARVVRLQMPPDPHRSTICDHVRCGGTWADVYWSSDASQLAFVSTSRNHQDEYVRIADATTGEVREVMEEHVETFFESGYNSVNWRFLPDSDELLWYSQKDDWGHLYLHDLESGAEKRQITSGAWKVLRILRLDEEERMIYFTGAGREPGDPYFQYFYSVDMDGGAVRLLTPDSANHSVSFSPTGDYFLDTYSTPLIPPRVSLRALDGELVTELEEADITPLVESGWQPPIPFTTKARDGVTDLHGLMYQPTNFDSSQSYPVLNYQYPGPQSGSVGSRNFSASRSDKQALAELGFIVVEVDAMGTPMRSHSFQAIYYGNMGDNGLPDQITTIEQLAAERPWMDLSRVGIWGHSGGGFGAAAAIMRYPDFYHVAVSQAGNHDNRNYEDDWGEKWQGLLVQNADGSTTYDNQANQLLVENLRGKLLIAHGTMDNNVPPSNTMVVVDALIAANKDFDFILFPNRRHGFGSEPYMMRRRWDYFVRHLLGVEPPAGYEIGAGR